MLSARADQGIDLPISAQGGTLLLHWGERLENFDTTMRLPQSWAMQAAGKQRPNLPTAGDSPASCGTTSLSALVAMTRPADWTASKLPFLAAMALLAAPVPMRTGPLAAAIAIVSGLAAFGFAVNEVADRRCDTLAGKQNRARNLDGTQQALVVAAAAAVALGFAVALARGPAGPLLLAADMALAALYSLPPLRLKERGLLGIAAAAVSQWSVPVLALAALLGAGLGDPEVWASAALGLAIGVRWMAIHQAQDIEADRRAGVTTFATRGGPMLRIISAALGAECILLAMVLALSWPHSEGALVALLCWACLALLTAQQRPPLAQALPTYAYAPLSAYYFLLLPVSLALARMSSVASAVLAAVLFAALGSAQAAKVWGETTDAIRAHRRL